MCWKTDRISDAACSQVLGSSFQNWPNKNVEAAELAKRDCGLAPTSLISQEVKSNSSLN